jgi:hypothetical protein
MPDETDSRRAFLWVRLHGEGGRGCTSAEAIELATTQPQLDPRSPFAADALAKLRADRAPAR